jgi:hypothetical protein
MSDTPEPTHQETLNAHHDALVRQHQQEEAQLAVEMFRLNKRRDHVKTRLDELVVILGTALQLDPKEKEKGENNNKPTGGKPGAEE